MNAHLLIQQLTQQLNRQQQLIENHLQPLGLPQLNFKEGPDRWSILECLEHLNRYSAFYNAALEQALKAAPAAPLLKPFSQSWLGAKAIESIDPANPKKQKTFKRMNPSGSQLGADVLNTFQQHLAQLLHLLHQAEGKDLSRKAVPIEFFKLLKMNIGESFQFMLAHQERHLQQALRVKQAQLQQTARAA